MENIERLQPRAFTKFCMSIGMVPSSYTTALTYEEQLLWFCSYLEKEVIPAVNNNAEAVTELQGLYTQLKDYVDHYFDNLDVQQEINNKLDDMAESGELTDIIAQYLELAGVLAYDTVDDMKVAENLTEGSICKTLGYSNIQDKNGSFYKVREILNTDVIDNINIIALEDENLVAEKIQEKQPLISYKPSYIKDNYYFTISYGKSKPSLFVSKDSVNWQKVFEIQQEAFMEDCQAGYDFSCIIDDGYFYMTYDYINEDFNGWSDLDPDLFRGGNRVGVARTKDFINWEKWNLDIDLQYKQTFAPEFFIDSDDSHYITVSLSTTEIKDTRYYKKNFIIRTDNDFKNIVSTTNNLDVNFVNIDGSIFKEGTTYYLSVKDEESKTIKIYSSSNIASFSTLVSEVALYDKEGNISGVEGPCIIKIGSRYVLFTDAYSLDHASVIFVSEDLEHWSNWNILPTPETMYHFSPVLTTNTTKPILEIGYEVLNYPSLEQLEFVTGKLNEYNKASASYPYTLFVPLPNATYTFFGNDGLTITPINMFFTGSNQSKEFSVVNGAGSGDPVSVVCSNQTCQVAPKNGQIFGGIWNNTAINTHGVSLNPVELSITGGTNITINYQACYRIGQIVNLVVSFTPSANIAAYDEIFTNVPKSFNSLLFPIVERNTTTPTLTSVDKWAYITDGGIIQAQRALSSGQNYRFSVTYFCK